MDYIHINGIKAYAYHGALPAEREIGQFFLADVTLGLDLTRAGRHDDLTKTVHYGEAYHVIHAILTGEPVNLIEHLASNIIDKLFDVYDDIMEITVTITKPSPPIDGHYDSVGVTLNRER